MMALFEIGDRVWSDVRCVCSEGKDLEFERFGWGYIGGRMAMTIRD